MAYLQAAVAELTSTAKLELIGLGNAMQNAAKIACWMVDVYGCEILSLDLAFPSLMGRMLDPNDPKALEHKRFVPTGVSEKVPKLTIRLHQKGSK